MSGIAPNPLNAISKVYLDQVAESAVPGKPAEKLKTDRAGYSIPKSEQESARERILAKTKAKREKMKESYYDPMDDSDFDHDEAEKNRGVSGKNNPKGGKSLGKKKVKEGLDPVGQEDGDVDNDGKKNTNADKYLMKRRKAIGKALATRKEETQITEIHTQAHTPHEVPSGDIKKLVSKAVKRYDADNDGDVDKDDPKEKGMGEFVPSPDGKKKLRTKIGESMSNWRQDLSEVMNDEIDSKKIKEKKVNNKIKINPEFKESIEQIGGTIIEMVEIDELDYVIDSVYGELLDEGYEEDDVEEVIEYALTEATVTFGHDTDKPHEKDTSAGRMIKAVGRLARQKLKSAGKKARLKSAQAQVAAYNKGREVAQTAGDKVRRAKKTVSDSSKKAKTDIKVKIKRAAQKVVDRMSEETEIEEGIGMTMANAVGNPPALSKRMKLKQALLNREIKKNAAANKKKSYSGKAAVSEAVKGQDTESRREAAAERRSGEKRLSPSKGKGYADQQKQSISYMDKLTKKNKNVVGLVTKEEFIDPEQGEAPSGRTPLQNVSDHPSASVRRKAIKGMRKQMGKEYGGKWKSKSNDPVKEEVEQIDEKALSKAQQRFMGMVYAVKKGEMKAPSPEVAKAAASMTGKEAKDFAKTKHKGLPEKKEVKEQQEEDPKEKQMLAKKKQMMQRQYMLDRQRLQMQQQGKLPTGHSEKY